MDLAKRSHYSSNRPHLHIPADVLREKFDNDSVEFDQIKVEDGFGYAEFSVHLEFLEIDEIIPETMSCGRQWSERFKGVDQVEESAVFVSTF